MLTWAQSHRRINHMANAFMRAVERRKDGPVPSRRTWKAQILDMARCRLAVVYTPRFRER